MFLLIMAHRGEAQVFIKKYDLKQIEDNLYACEEFHLLITGEGSYEVFTKISKINLNLYTEIINMGISGSLYKRLEINKVYEIRTVYSDSEYQSYTTNNNAEFDLVTTTKRIINSIENKKLKPIADIVDREAWAVARVAAYNKKSFYCYKLISDYANDDTSCFDIKQKAYQLSELMFEFFSKKILQRETSKIKSNKKEYFPIKLTQTQRHQVEKIVKNIALRDEIPLEQVWKNSVLQNIIKSEIPEKKKAKEIIVKLQEILNPFMINANKQMNETLDGINKIGATTHWDTSFEKQGVTISMNINSQKNIDSLKRVLDGIKYTKISKIFNGDIDV